MLTVHPSTAMATAEAGSPGLDVTYDKARPWYEQWYVVRQQLAEVEDTLANRREIDRVKRVFEDFFEACTHLGDWIGNGRSTAVSKGQASRHLKADLDLTICHAVANTSKHRTRYSGSMTGGIQNVSFDEHGITTTIAWTDGNASGTVDALALAKRRVASWERFIADNNLHSPL